MAVHKIQVSVELAEVNCGVCGGTYAINNRYREQKRIEGGSWTCPYCKTGWGFYGTNENAQLKKSLEKEKKRREWAESNAAREREKARAAERRRIAQKGVSTRLKNRAKAGVCPCCTRTFKQLAAHMKNKHPDYDAS